jgi:putative transposase
MFVQRLNEEFEEMTITAACEYVDHSRSGYYKWLERKDEESKKPGPKKGVYIDEWMVQRIREVREEMAPIQVGYRRITAILNHKKGITVNKKKVQRINQIMGWQASSYRRPTRPKSDPQDPNRPVVDPGDPVQVDRPNQRWSTDLTKIYIKGEGWANLIPVVDNCTRECLGWVFSRRGRAKEAQDAIREAVINRFGSEQNVPEELELLTDNGSIFLAKDFMNQMDEYGIDQTFTPFECPSANGLAERFIETVKEEKTWHFVFESMDEAEEAIREFIQEYNEERLHSSLDYTPPATFAEQFRKKVA